jgi:cytochrome c oxidase assembly factor CtaG
VKGWDVSPLVLGAALLALLQFGRAFARLRRRGRSDHAGWDRAALFAAGIAVSVLPLVSPLAGSSLSGHMLEHVLVGDLGPALLLLAVRGPLLFFMLPPLATRSVARRAPLRRAAALLVRPWVALTAWAAAYAGWHLPAAYHYALAHETAHGLQHLSFLVVGTLVWVQLVGPAGRNGLSVGARLAFAGAIFAFGQILSDLLLLAGRPLFPPYADEAGALRDQQIAGLVMMVEQLLTLGTCAALLVRSCLRRGRVRPTAAAARA